MTPERWEQVGQIHQAALELPTEERAAFLDRACGLDESLRREVESLLAVEGEAGEFLAAGAIRDAAKMLAEESPGSMVGQSIGPYQILSHLGEGGMGEVYLAEDTRLGRKIALKLLLAGLSEDTNRVRRFEQEARAASALNHPNIITVYEIGQWNGRDFIATEFVEGVTLRRRMRAGRLPLATAIEIALQITSALAAAHRAGIVHRDIKPENVMLRPDGLIKILDFGIAKYTETTGVRSRNPVFIKTAPGEVIGTAAYMSPEQARGLPVDARTDIWSLGVMLYEMVARRLPFPGATPTDRIAAILEREPEPLSKLRRGIPPELERIINRALAKNREERYAQAADMAADLGKFRATLSDEPLPRFALPAPARSLAPLSRPRSLIVLVALSLIFVVLTATAIVYFRSVAGGAAVDSLAVLPLENVGGNPDTEYLVDGITESLINDLSQISSLRVMARSTVFRYKGQEVNPQEVGRELGIKAVLVGRIDQRGETLVVQADLVKVEDGSQLWGERFNRRTSDLLAVQEEISREITEKLRLRLSGEEQTKLAKRHTANPAAYEAYLKGHHLVNRRTQQSIEKSIEYLEQAVRIDPSYALAYAYLAYAYSSLYYFSAGPPKEIVPKAREAVMKALEIDNTLAEAHVQLAANRHYYDRNWEEAEKSYRRALELDPNSAHAHRSYAFLLLHTKRYDEALTEMKRALELEPVSIVINQSVAQILLYSRRYDEAIEQCRRTLELDPGFGTAYGYLGLAYEAKGQYAEAVKAYLENDALLGGSPERVAALRAASEAAGWRGYWRKTLEMEQERSKQRYVSPYRFASIYIRLGEKEEALRWLEKAYEDRNYQITRLNVEPLWDGLRQDPRFTDLAKRTGLEADPRPQ